MSSTRRLVAVLSIAALSAAACTNKKKDAEITPQPTDRSTVEQVSDFQIVGTIEQAFAGAVPPGDIPTDDVAAVAGPTDSPSATPVGDRASINGVLRIDTEDVSKELTKDCGVQAGQSVDVYWTNDTRFDGSDVLDEVNLDEADLDASEIEDAFEDEVAGVAGRVYRAGDEPAGIRRGTDGVGCVLLADQVGFEQAGTSPTVAPAPRRTSAPTAEPDEPDETGKPTAEPDETEKPKKTPLGSATPTAEQKQ